jgi:DNA-binding Lrp family transcriptional regulator
MESTVVDRTDRQIIHALLLDPRASFSSIAAAVAVSEQTVARRYRRLRADGVVRVHGLVDPRHLGQDDWLFRMRCRPDGANAITDALARRPDVSWVTVNAGGTEISCAVRSTTEQQREDLLRRLPKTVAVLDITAQVVLHRFVGQRTDDWVGFGDLLTGDQIDVLAPAAMPETVLTAALGPDDQPLLAALERDGRVGYAALAMVTGWSEGRVARRLEALQASRVVYFDVDLSPELLGFKVAASLWLRVAPTDLAGTGEQLAAHSEVAFAAAISGTANLFASVICANTDALYRYITTKLAAIPAIQQVDVTPISRRVKQAGSLVDSGRLIDPVQLYT